MIKWILLIIASLPSCASHVENSILCKTYKTMSVNSKYSDSKRFMDGRYLQCIGNGYLDPVNVLKSKDFTNDFESIDIMSHTRNRILSLRSFYEDYTSNRPYSMIQVLYDVWIYNSFYNKNEEEVDLIEDKLFELIQHEEEQLLKRINMNIDKPKYEITNAHKSKIESSNKCSEIYYMMNSAKIDNDQFLNTINYLLKSTILIDDYKILLKIPCSEITKNKCRDLGMQKRRIANFQNAVSGFFDKFEIKFVRNKKDKEDISFRKFEICVVNIHNTRERIFEKEGNTLKRVNTKDNKTNYKKGFVMDKDVDYDQSKEMIEEDKKSIGKRIYKKQILN